MESIGSVAFGKQLRNLCKEQHLISAVCIKLAYIHGHLHWPFYTSKQLNKVISVFRTLLYRTLKVCINKNSLIFYDNGTKPCKKETIENNEKQKKKEVD